MNAIPWALLCSVLLAPAPAPAVDLPAAAKEVLKQFEDDAVVLEKRIEAETKKVEEKTAAELKKLQDGFCKEAKLDEAVAVRDLIRAMRAGTPITLAADLPAAAREVYKGHEKELANLPHKAEAGFKERREKTIRELKKVQ